MENKKYICVDMRWYVYNICINFPFSQQFVPEHDVTHIIQLIAWEQKVKNKNTLRSLYKIHFI